MYESRELGNMNDPRMPVATDVEIDVRALFISLLKALPFILIFTMLAGAGTFYLLSNITPTYKSQTTVLIESGESDVTRSSSTAETAAVLDREAVASQVQLIRSGDLAKIVANKLDLESQPEYQKAIKGDSFINNLLVEFGLAKSPTESSIEERVLTEYYKNLQVVAIADSRVITIAFSSTSPELAARGANMIAAEYIALQRTAMRDTNENATQWLESEISDLRKKVAASEASVADFRSANDLFTSGGQTPTTLNQQTLADLNTERAKIRATRADAETKAAQIKASLKSGAVPNIPEVLNSQLIQRLIEQQVGLRAQIAELSATLLPGHPRMRELKAQLADLDSQVTAEAQKIVAALDAEVDLSTAREADIDRRLDQLKATVTTAGDAEVQLRALEREATAQRALLDTYLLRYREAIGRQNGDYLPANARIISSAIVPIEPDFPKIIPMTAAALAAAFLLAIAFFLVRELSGGRPMRRVAYGEPLPIVPNAMPIGGHVRWADDHGVRRMMPSEPTLAPLMASESEKSLSRISGDIVSRGRHRILVTLAEGSDDSGRPLAAAALARALARADRRTVLIDFRGDGANGAAMCEGTNLPGFTDLFAGEASFAQVVFRDRRSRAHFIPPGRSPLSPNILDGERLATVLGALDQTYDHLVMDANDDMIDVLGPSVDAAMVVSEFGAADPRTIQAFDRITAVSSANIMLLIVDPPSKRKELATKDSSEESGEEATAGEAA